MPTTQTNVAPHTRTAPKAGPTEKLVVMANRIARDSRDIDEAADALLAGIGNDAGLLLALIEHDRQRIAADYLRRVAGVHVKAYSRARPGMVPQQQQPTRGLATIQGAQSATAAAILDTHMTELGRPVGDLNKAELSALAERTAGRSRFYGALATAIPPTGTVREYIDNAEAARIWEAAHKPA